jgi:4-hydroxybenzoate polyprenyltransferase
MSIASASVSPAARLRTYASFVRFEHTLFSLPLILAGIFSAPGPPMSASRWLLIAVAAVGARTTAMALNRLIDRRLDALNPRTQVRELPTGRMKLFEAIALLVASTVAYLLACAALGPWFLKVAFVPLAVFTIYPYLKRFTAFCHLGVGAGLALAPLAGFAAAHPALEHWQPAVLLSVFALFWVAGFDIIYATLDEEFDRANGVHSMVAWLGRENALRVSFLFHMAANVAFGYMLNAIAGPATRVSSPWWYSITVVLGLGTAFLLFLEVGLAKNVNLAFFKVNVWVGFGVLISLLAARMAAGGFGS